MAKSMRFGIIPVVDVILCIFSIIMMLHLFYKVWRSRRMNP